MNRAEQRIQTAIVVAYRKRFDCRIIHIPNGGARTKLEAIAMRDAGATAGAPDLPVWSRDGQMFLMEVKQPKEILVRERDRDPFERLASADPAQRLFIADLRERGFTVAIVCSVEEALSCAEVFGLAPKRAVAPRSDLAMSTGF